MRVTHYCWEETQAESPLSFTLSLDRDALLFKVLVRCPPTRNLSGFEAGLWQGDVAELFLLSDDRASYFEFNFAAGGAWWASSFSGPREFKEELPDCVEILQAGSDSDSWWVEARVKNLDYSDPIVGNVCGIVGQQRRYISLLPLTNEIDFHRPECFRELLN